MFAMQSKGGWVLTLMTFGMVIQVYPKKVLGMSDCYEVNVVIPFQPFFALHQASLTEIGFCLQSPHTLN